MQLGKAKEEMIAVVGAPQQEQPEIEVPVSEASNNNEISSESVALQLGPKSETMSNANNKNPELIVATT